MNTYIMEFIVIRPNGEERQLKSSVLANTAYEAEEIIKRGISRTKCKLHRFVSMEIKQ